MTSVSKSLHVVVSGCPGPWGSWGILSVLAPDKESSIVCVYVCVCVGGVWYGMVKQLGLSASLLAGRIAKTPLPQLPPDPG